MADHVFQAEPIQTMARHTQKLKGIHSSFRKRKFQRYSQTSRAMAGSIDQPELNKRPNHLHQTAHYAAYCGPGRETVPKNEHRVKRSNELYDAPALKRS
jgi:hypothetical protein